MKQLYSILIIGIALCLSSCSKDLSESVIGTWSIASVEIEDCPDDGITGRTINAENGCLVLFGDMGCIAMTFTEGGNGLFTTTYDDDETSIEPFTYTVNDDEKIVTICAEEECIDAEYDGGLLTLMTEEDGCPMYMRFEEN